MFITNNFLSDLLPEYFNRYPKIELELVVSDHFIDLVDRGFDLAIRAGELKGSTLVVRKLMDVELVLVATLLYPEQHGRPKTVSDLKAHNCLIDTTSSYKNHWPVADKKNGKYVTVEGNVRANSGETVRSLALSGRGIALMPKFFFARDIYEGRLASFLDSKIQFSGGIFAAYPQRKHLSPNVRSFIDYLVGYIDQLELLCHKQ